MANVRILVADDDSLMREFVLETLNRLGYDVIGVEDGQSALEALENEEFNIVITDIKMPGADGIEVLRTAQQLNPKCKVILVTAYGTIDNAVTAMKGGAFDYLTKGEKTSPDELEIIVKKALDFQKLETENQRLKTELAGRYSFSNMIGKSPNVLKIYDLIQTVSNSSASILITGKSGTGKELVARAIHFNSGRRNKPFIKLNCAALPDGLVEAELFGHEKGAFTGAIKTVKGRFELADEGTLLLDEISEMSFTMQAKLLRVLQEREFERVGSGNSIRTDVRILATSNKNLKEQVQKGNFREDLYYRLNVIPISIPDLSERREDISLLTDHFISRYSEKNKKQVSSISEEAIQILTGYSWPGNVRELENVIEGAVVVNKTGVIEETDLPPYLKAIERTDAVDWIRPGISISTMEKELIIKTIEAYEGNRTRASEELGITTRTLRNKLHEYGIGNKHQSANT